MLSKGTASKVVIHINEATRHDRKPLWEVIFNYLHRQRVQGANVTRPIRSFGCNGVVRTLASEYSDASLRIEFIETKERAKELLPTICEMVSDGLIEIQDTTIVKAASPKRWTPEESGLVKTDHQQAQMMHIIINGAGKHAHKELCATVVKTLKLMNVAGATLHKSLDTTQAGSASMISVVDTCENISRAATAIAGIVGDGMVLITDAISLKTLLSVGTGAPNSCIS